MSRHRVAAPAPRRKLLLTLGALALGLTCLAGGTYAVFTSTTSSNNTMQFSGGLVTLTLPAPGTTNRLSVSATNIVPGDTMQRAVDLQNSGNTNMSSITLTTTASPSSLLDTDVTNGLQVLVERCSAAWTEGGVAPGYTYTCGGTRSTVLASRAVIGSNLALANLTATTAATTDHLLMTLAFPAAATNSMQGLSSTLAFAFTGTQRTATNQ